MSSRRDEPLKTDLEARQQEGWRLHRLSPNYGQCGRCHTPWRYVEGHTTLYRDSQGCFPLCKLCWSELTPEARLPYYRALWFKWLGQTAAIRSEEGVEQTELLLERWPFIEKAVLAGG